MISDCKRRLPLPALWAALGLAGADQIRPGGVTIKSPFREERRPSLEVKQRPSGWFWKDHANPEWQGDEVDLIRFARDVEKREAIRIYHELCNLPWGESGEDRPKRKRAVKKKRPVKAEKPGDNGTGGDLGGSAPPPTSAGSSVQAIYDYCDAGGKVVHQTIRFEPKAFRQRRPLRDGESWPGGDGPFVQDGWVYSLAGIELVPYRLPAVLACPASEPVFFCEGEKDADSVAERLGLCSTTVAMGAGKWREEYAEFFKGKWVCIVVDEDSAGEKGAIVLGKGLMPVVSRLSVVRMADLPWPAVPTASGAPGGAVGSEVPSPAADAPAGCNDGALPSKALKRDITDWVEAWPDSPVEELAEELLAVAETGEPPIEVLYDGIVKIGDRGAVQLRQGALADRLVKHRGLCWIEGGFWRWRMNGKERGVWRKVECEEQVHAWIRQVLEREELTRPLSEARLVSSVARMARSSQFAHPDQLNGHDPYLLNCRSGMLNTLTGEVLPHGAGYWSTSQVPLAWDPEAECPRWLDWLEEMQPDAEVRNQIQEMFGYCLVPAVNYHVFFFLYGDGGTGKSTCAELLQELVGETNTLALQLEELANAFTRSLLVGKQLYLCGELTKHSFKHIGLIKQISSGEPIFVDVKGSPGYTYRPRGRFVMTSNVVAHTPDTTGGFERRFLQINWENAVPLERRDYRLKEKLLAELPGIFRWSIEGFRRLHERGRFEHTAASQAATAELMRHRASVKEFLFDREWLVDNGPNGEGLLTAKDLFEHYQAWADFHGVNAYYKEVESFAKEAYRRWPALKERRVRREADGERQICWPGLQVTAPEGWG